MVASNSGMDQELDGKALRAHITAEARQTASEALKLVDAALEADGAVDEAALATGARPLHHELAHRKQRGLSQEHDAVSLNFTDHLSAARRRLVRVDDALSQVLGPVRRDHAVD